MRRQFWNRVRSLWRQDAISLVLLREAYESMTGRTISLGDLCCRVFDNPISVYQEPKP